MRFTRTMHIAAEREEVWNLFADTDRLNREVGLPPVTYEFLPRAVGGTESFATTHLGPLGFRFHERPYEWVKPEFFTELRLFERGPVKEFRVRMGLEPRDGGTLLRCEADLTPRSAIFAPMVGTIGQKFMGDLERAWRSFAAYLTGKIQTPYPKHRQQFPVVRERLEQAVREVVAAGADAAVVKRLAEYLAESPPEDVTQMRPFVLAEAWGFERMAVLQAFLLAARARDGLLEMRWRLLCPSCRGSASQNTHRHLRDVREEVHCPSCNIRFDADFDQSVEVCFAVAPRIRPVQETVFCRGGPMMTPHIAAQWVLNPDETRKVTLNLPPGRYVLVSPQASASVNIVVEKTSPPAPLPAARLGSLGEGRTLFESASLLRANGERGLGGEVPASEEVCVELRQGALDVSTPHIAAEATWTLNGRTKEWAVLRLESQEVGYPVATAALVTSLQAFRDQFSGEVLSPGTELAVRQVCVLFSDLKGSTAMYREQGDAPSYRMVRDHFQAMRRIVGRHEGAVVKTIGDAIMATFTDSAQGLAAALEIQRAALDWPDRLTVKLGLHSGPAIAVNANDLLDYFGQTVNLAARLQTESEGNDIVIAEELTRDPLIARMLETEGCRLERFRHAVRGFDQPIAMLRITLPSATP
jgi:adenylate cyclase